MIPIHIVHWVVRCWSEKLGHWSHLLALCTIETIKWSYDSDSYCTLMVGRCNRKYKQVFDYISYWVGFDTYTTDAKYWREKSTIGYSVG